MGRVEGQFVLTRQINQHSPELSDDVLRSLKLEPTEENTRLLYDNPDLGMRFLYPRRWKVMGVRGRQVAVDDANGNGLLLTVETAPRVPTGAQYLQESKDWLEQQKAKILAVEPPRRLPADKGELEHFGLDVQLPTQKVLMDYYVIRQALGGATVAARLLASDSLDAKKDVETIARSVAILRTIRNEENSRR